MYFQNVTMKNLAGEEIGVLQRARVPGGWFIRVIEQTVFGALNEVRTTAAFFYPDAEHTWDGTSLS